jgi:hypothetical protein
MAPDIASHTRVALDESPDFVCPGHRAVLLTRGADGAGRIVTSAYPERGGYRRAVVEQGKPLIRVAPERWGPVATGGFPARPAEDD